MTPGQQRWWRISLLVFAAYLACYVDRNNISIAAPEMMRTFTLGGVGTGLLLSAFFWGFLTTQVPGGWLASRFGPKAVIVACLVGVGISGALTGLVRDLNSVLLMRFLLGVAEGAVLPSFAVITMRWFPAAERSRAVNMTNYVLPLSSTLMAPVSGWMIHAFGWRAMFVLQAIPALILALLWMRFSADDPAEDPRLGEDERGLILATRDVGTSERGRTIDVFRRPMIWGLCVAYFFWVTGMYGFGLWLPSLIRQISGGDIVQVAWLTAIPYGAAAIALFINVTWAERGRHTKALHFIVPLAAGGVAMLLQSALHPGLLPSMALLVVACMSIFCGLGLWWSWAFSFAPRNVVGVSVGLINLVGNSGGIVGPIVVGAATERFGPSGGFAVVGGALLAAAAANVALTLWSRRQTSIRLAEPTLSGVR